MDNEIYIVPFRFKYFRNLVDMHSQNQYLNMGAIAMKTLPKIGYIVFTDKGYPVAAGFLRRLEGGFAQIDTLVSNPTFGAIIRHKAIDLLVTTLLEEAEHLGLNGVIAFTSENSIVERAKDKGFQVLSNQILIGKSFK